jgi:penicillin amidase
MCDVLGSSCKEHDKNFSLGRYERVEGAIWRIVSEKPAHLIDPRFDDWNALLLAAADAEIADATRDGAKLADYTWGRENTTRIAHPLSAAVPRLAGWLDMVSEPLAGDWSDMPHIQTPRSGASQRMAVSPGKEAEGYMHMPCGQSGHPLSPHYRDGHAAWGEGKATPFLPGKPVHTLVLEPRENKSAS